MVERPRLLAKAMPGAPSPVTITQRTSVSDFTCSQACCSSRVIFMLKALRRSGEFLTGNGEKNPPLPGWKNNGAESIISSGSNTTPLAAFAAKKEGLFPTRRGGYTPLK